MNTSEIKKRIQQYLLNKLKEIDGVLSVSLVGSFVNQKNLSGISDIDTIVICRTLSNSLYQSCIKAASSIDLPNCGLDNYEPTINSTFGPLKFDGPNLVVIHLMVYDLAGHRKHVLSSPFTCFDWERTRVFSGVRLNKIFPVGGLQFRDFFEARRGLDDYLDDLGNNVISYREYDFTRDEIVEVINKKSIDERHQAEYAYHIVRNLVANYLKFRRTKNVYFTNGDILEEINRLMPKTARFHCDQFSAVTKLKSKTIDSFPGNASDWAKQFSEEFQKNILKEWSNAISVHFIRHFKTALNDGTYFGQGRDPSMQIVPNVQANEAPRDKIYSSPLRRCTETAAILFQNKNIVIDELLLEFNYGEAEGLTSGELDSRYPAMTDAWCNGEDPRFPRGENTIDVYKRLKLFLNNLSVTLGDGGNYSSGVSVVTHNGVLRCLLGDALNLTVKDWHKLDIPHALSLEFLYWNNRFYPNIPKPVLGDILKDIGY